MKLCLVNGIQQNHIDIESRGLAYGDGLFTTVKIIDGNVQYLAQHIERLTHGCAKLGISTPSSSHLKKQLTLVAKNHELAVLKVIITARSGGRGYTRATENAHDVIMMVFDYPKQYDRQAQSGISVGISQQKIGINPMLNGLKHLNRLEQVLLKQELLTKDVDDLLVTNIHNEVIEATSANVFFFINKKWYTPDISQSGVNGIIRQAILKQFPNTEVTKLSLDDIGQAQAMFICNCIMSVIPISNFNGRKLSTDLPLNLRHQLNKK